MKCGAIILNKYYSDSGTDYLKSRLKEEFLKFGCVLDEVAPFADFEYVNEFKKYSFALFFDKDYILARLLEKTKIRFLNSAKTIEVCDNKIKTYLALERRMRFPKTYVAPLVYENCRMNEDFAGFGFEQKLSYPVVVKENVGSLGKQVYLATNPQELLALQKKLFNTPHHYQEFVGENPGEDYRVYVVGCKAVALIKRRNTTDFRSNVSLGSQAELLPLQKELAMYAQSIAIKLNLKYGTVDFILHKGEYVFIEANSNAYFKAVESLGVNIAQKIAEYILEV